MLWTRALELGGLVGREPLAALYDDFSLSAYGNDNVMLNAWTSLQIVNSRRVKRQAEEEISRSEEVAQLTS